MKMSKELIEQNIFSEEIVKQANDRFNAKKSKFEEYFEGTKIILKSITNLDPNFLKKYLKLSFTISEASANQFMQRKKDKIGKKVGEKSVTVRSASESVINIKSINS